MTTFEHILYIFRIINVLERKKMDINQVGGMSVRRLAAARNAASAASFTRKMNDLMRQQSLDEPMRGFEEIRGRASANIAALEGGLEKARRFILDVKERREAGLLDAQTAAAEALPAQTVVELAASLRVLFERACGANNTYPLKRVNIAAQVLAGNINNSLLSAVRYPESEHDIRDALIRERKEQAGAISEDVRESLDGVDAELSVPMPFFRSNA